jgi:hypothetical protein
MLLTSRLILLARRMRFSSIALFSPSTPSSVGGFPSLVVDIVCELTGLWKLGADVAALVVLDNGGEAIWK